MQYSAVDKAGKDLEAWREQRSRYNALQKRLENMGDKTKPNTIHSLLSELPQASLLLKIQQLTALVSQLVNLALDKCPQNHYLEENYGTGLVSDNVAKRYLSFLHEEDPALATSVSQTTLNEESISYHLLIGSTPGPVHDKHTYQDPYAGHLLAFLVKLGHELNSILSPTN